MVGLYENFDEIIGNLEESNQAANNFQRIFTFIQNKNFSIF